MLSACQPVSLSADKAGRPQSRGVVDLPNSRDLAVLYREVLDDMDWPRSATATM
jgi:hypothetical protein